MSLAAIAVLVRVRRRLLHPGQLLVFKFLADLLFAANKVHPAIAFAPLL